MASNKFVYIVCGPREYIDTLHFSLRYLKHFSSFEIIVVTDTLRNEIKVEHDKIIDVRIPTSLNNLQASRYLKTNLHSLLPKGPLYCYVDTDLIALSKECDEVFKYRNGIINFGPDLCRMGAFSPAAVHCECQQINLREKEELQALMEKYDPRPTIGGELMIEKRQRLLRSLDSMKANKKKELWKIFRFLTSVNSFKLDEDTFYKPREKLWRDKDGRVIMVTAEKVRKEIETHTKWQWSRRKKSWISPAGNNVFDLRCPHLAQFIFNRFGIKVMDTNFQHWNAGLFLFDEASYNFMELWRKKTEQIFEFPEWKTRDQGSLIAAIWEYGLQNQKLLPKKFNFIGDWNKHKMKMDGEGNFTDDGFKTSLRPAFIHIYENFGKRGWPVWDYIESIGSTFKNGLR